jgi:hypothetical protein
LKGQAAPSAREQPLVRTGFSTTVSSASVIGHHPFVPCDQRFAGQFLHHLGRDGAACRSNCQLLIAHVDMAVERCHNR